MSTMSLPSVPACGPSACGPGTDGEGDGKACGPCTDVEACPPMVQGPAPMSGPGAGKPDEEELEGAAEIELSGMVWADCREAWYMASTVIKTDDLSCFLR